MTKGVYLKGAGIDSTIIHHASSQIFSYAPATPADDTIFSVSGFTLDGDGTNTAGGLILISNSSTDYAITQVSIFSNKFKDTKDSIYIVGAVYGVAYANKFDDCQIVFRDLGKNRDSWDNYPFAYGDANNFYFEDNEIYHTHGNTGGWVGWVEGGQGGRYCIRYNSWDCTNVTGYLDMLDMHGNQKATGESYATMGAEVYENTYTGIGAGLNKRIMYQRGGKLLMYNNTYTVNGGNNYFHLAEEYADSLSPTNASDIQHVNTSYYWNNLVNGVNKAAWESSDPLGELAENSEYWNYNASFDGTTGVGVGLKAARPATCTTGVGYWATDESKLYVATGTNTWSNPAFYTPYTYPHPLRSAEMEPEVSISEGIILSDSLAGSQTSPPSFGAPSKFTRAFY